jgi:aspartate/methionine/tyrosine aminotransferase
MRHNAMSLALRGESPLPCTMPRGAFYAFPRISEWLEELSVRTDFLAEILLDEFGLACLPGTTFGPGAQSTFASPSPPLVPISSVPSTSFEERRRSA